jgi:PAS domain S-box-containing protein
MQTETDTQYSFVQSTDRTHALVNCLKVGVLLQDSSSEILFCNRAASEILGISKEEIYRRSVINLGMDMVYEDGSAVEEKDFLFDMAVDTKKAVGKIMGVWRPLTNDRVWLQVNAEPLLDQQGNVIEVVTSFTDITEHKEAREKLTSLYQHLEMRAFEIATTNADLEKFVYAATHDLQEPLRLISSFVQLLESKYGHQLDLQAQEYIRFAVDGAKRMKKLILDLLEYSKFTGAGMIMVPTDLNRLMEKVHSNVSGQLKELNAGLLVHPLPVAYIHPALIIQLFENLVDNALKYRGKDVPFIEINCCETDDKWQFSVRDNGIGIETGYSAKIFDLFQRLHSNGLYEGTGVGLAICQKIVRLHRGEIWVDSEPGKGSTFYFTIPIVNQQLHEKV